MTGEQYHAVVAEPIPAINSQQIKVQVAEMPFLRP